MTFRANEKLKNEVVSQVIENSRGLRVLAKCVKYAIPVAITIAVVYACLFWLVPDLGVVIVAGTAKKEIVPIISRAILILVFGIILHYCCGFMIINRTGKDLTERTEEELVVTDGEIRYIFRTKYVTSPENRVVVVIPLRDITSVSYNNKTRKIELIGRISSDVVEKFNPAYPYNPNKGNLKDLVIYDYFTPSLLDSLHSHGLI